MSAEYVDVLIVGAGFGGIYQVHSLRDAGLSLKVVEAAPDVGGTWWWNRYPGAMSDTESYLYRYSWDKEDLQTYPWNEHYLFQPEILKYLNHVVDKHDLRKYMEFNTEMVSADYDETANTWRVGLKTAADENNNNTSSIREITTRYLVTALGLLTKQNRPDIPGLDSFAGQIVHSQSWTPDIDVAGKRVGVIGSGSTGVQIVTALGPQPVATLTSFQRHPQYSVPSGNKRVEPAYRAWVNAHYDDIYADMRSSMTAFGVPESTRSFHDAALSPSDRTAVFEELWARGNGFRFMFGGFADLTTDREANEAACDFIRGKIAAKVRDPGKARRLMPREMYARRPLCDNGYYEQFNRPNVDVVNLQETPIEAVTPDGIRTSDGKTHALDLLILATGFDVIDGSFARIRIRGRDGHSLREHWADGPVSYLGFCVAGFPNLFTIGGPQGPFCNFPPAVESGVEFIREAIGRAEEEVRRREEEARRGGEGGSGDGGVVVEATEEAERGWVELCERLSRGSLFRDTKSWIFGHNVPGKPIACRFYFGGYSKHCDTVRDVIEGGWRGFKPFAKSRAVL
ncbi:cyclohexanone monooxygenase [Diplodia corticola]|uniref:Cyclohexanone monooxygenase n=1 Tax=Diplodia corticola TaxID=236234 RepID=A0A1J9RDV8_9PEZI|nr:cyclohexanone monooxygenase [Diplodia corticola]OJD30739.1 cyclohexanone monooxygenase [Diplodia corticola]